MSASTFPDMDKSTRAIALEAAYELLETPRSHLRVRFEQTEDAVLLSYQGDVLTGVELDESGINAASAMAVALGVDVPASATLPKCWFQPDCCTGCSQSPTWTSQIRPHSNSQTTSSTKPSRCSAVAEHCLGHNRGWRNQVAEPPIRSDLRALSDHIHPSHRGRIHRGDG